MIEQVIIVRDKTRLEQLVERFNSKGQAKFYIESSGGDFKMYEEEHDRFYKAFDTAVQNIGYQFKYKVLDRTFLTNYIFGSLDVIVVIGQDGLLANTAKYAKGLPIIGINPDDLVYDGVLVKHSPKKLMYLLNSVAKKSFKSIQVTMAKAVMNDGQTLLAFNDFYIGAASHISFKYEIKQGKRVQKQSSSGIIVSTGAGSTGWLSSVYNMAHNVYQRPGINTEAMNWDSDYLKFVVREPFLSKTSEVSLGMGTVTNTKTLQITSLMPDKGVIFSDGIESDFLQFNSGKIVTISTADEKACLVV